jgi:hypothetical protein
MSGLVAKLILCPLSILVTTFIFPGELNFANIYQILGVGFLLAALAHSMELVILRQGTFWISNGLDVVLSFALIYLSQFVLSGTSVTLMGAALVSALLFASEYMQHLYLIKGGNARKTP